MHSYAAPLDTDTVRIPTFLYGTAWKEDETHDCVIRAINTGFRGIDTANQRKHYVEAAVGSALKEILGSGQVNRDELFIQTKFTHLEGQDSRLPYDARADVFTQVLQSCERSLSNLGVRSIDSYLLHGPSARSILTDRDWQAWQAMEGLHREGRLKLLGVSNVVIEQLQSLYDYSTVKPRFVQNRCFAALGWDRDVRTFCNRHGIIYQGFSLLTANSAVLRSSLVREISKRHEMTPEQTIFAFARGIGMVPLTGTRDSSHMEQDLQMYGMALSKEELDAIETVATRAG